MTLKQVFSTHKFPWFVRRSPEKIIEDQQERLASLAEEQDIPEEFKITLPPHGNSLSRNERIRNMNQIYCGRFNWW